VKFDPRAHQLLAQLMEWDSARSELLRYYMGAAEFEHGAYARALDVLARHGETGETRVPRGTQIPSDPWSRKVAEFTERDMIVRWIAPVEISSGRYNDVPLHFPVRAWMPQIVEEVLKKSLVSREPMHLDFMFRPRRPKTNIVGWVNLSNDWHGKANTGLIHAAFVCDPADPRDPGERAWECFRSALAQRSAA